MDSGMKGKTVLFTGASRGMGHYAAIEHFEGLAPIRLMMNHVIPFFAAVGTERGSEQYATRDRSGACG
jgi:hypothetical protein